jgi:hypothetical protein
MKYIITESRLNDTIIEYLNNIYDVSDINWTNPYDYDDETDEEGENPNIIEFYRGDYEGTYDSDYVFMWYAPEHFPGPENISWFEDAPILEIHENEGETLNAYFGDKWHEPFKRWFEENFELPIKTIEVGIKL